MGMLFLLYKKYRKVKLKFNSLRNEGGVADPSENPSPLKYTHMHQCTHVQTISGI